MLLKGDPVSQGIEIGKVYILTSEEIPIPSYEIQEQFVEDEVARLKKAISLVIEELEEVKQRATELNEEEPSAIFDVHIAILKDPILLRNSISKIALQKKNAEFAFYFSIKNVIEILEKTKDPYFRERVIDIKDLSNKVIRKLIGKEGLKDFHIENPILVASQLSPSQTGPFQNIIKGLITEHGGRTSHTAILARALEIPAVVGVSEILNHAKSGDEVIIDGIEGIIILNPTPSEKKEYEEKKKAFIERREKLISSSKKIAKTLDGYHIKIKSNIDLEIEVKKAIFLGAEGIGLYRSEFLYLKCAPNLPTEEEHYETYKFISENVYPFKAVIRTLDFGGEYYYQKHLEPRENNPVLGLRAIRFSLRNPKIFLTQLKGILRASIKKNLEIMFPMITTLEDLRNAKALLNEAKNELKAKSIPFDEKIKVGIMVEVPICALNAEAFAKEVDFFSIGTNDLIQYLMAIDRNNENVSDYYDPYHPSFLRLLYFIQSVAKRNKIGLSICGEIASDPNIIPLLVGLGFDELSMAPQAILEAKEKICSLSYKECRKIALNVLKAKTGEEVRKILEKERLPKKGIFGMKWKS